jgi:hypothetical protein
MISQDKKYFAELAKQYPHLQGFIWALPVRFNNATRQTKCDGKGCGKKIRINQFDIFITPAPAYQPLVLCAQCLKFYYERYAETGQYDNHLWLTGKFSKN